MHHSQPQLVLYALFHIYTLMFLCTDGFSPHTQKALLEHSISSLLCMTHHANTCPDHHNNSSSSLAVTLMRSSSLCIILRFLSLSSSQDSSSSLSQSSSSSLSQLQATTLFHLSITSTNSLHSSGSYLRTLQLLWRSLYSYSS
jgi:hypothetical protein